MESSALTEFKAFVNPFPHIRVDVFWRLCSRRLFENIVTKEEIAQNEKFLILPQCFTLLVIGYPFNYRDFLFVDKICSKSFAAELSYEEKSLKSSLTFWKGKTAINRFLHWYSWWIVWSFIFTFNRISAIKAKRSPNFRRSRVPLLHAIAFQGK